MKTFFTSDTHYGHTNVIKYSKRPFSDVQHMEEELIHRWNSVVDKSDIVYHLGDFGFGKRDDVERILGKLNGQKFLNPGNHDKKEVIKAKGWVNVEHYREIKDTDGTKVVLLHYGMRVWNRSHHGSLQLYGHSHGSLPGTSQSLDVGVDCWDYYPVSLAQIRERMATLPPYGHPDHHTPARALKEMGESEPDET